GRCHVHRPACKTASVSAADEFTIGSPGSKVPARWVNGAPLLVKTVTEQGESIMGPIHGTTPQPGAPPRQGLYDPAYEHDACGVAFVATLRGTPGRDIVDAALTALANLDHRGAVGAEQDTGDGAGILTQIPDAFLRDVVDADLPAPGRYAVGLAFLPTEADALHDAVVGVEKIVRDE